MRLLLPLLATLTIANGCRRDKGECPSDRICTMEFRSIGVAVVDNAGAPVALDSVRTVRILDGLVYRFEPSTFLPENGFVVLTDAEMDAVDTRGVAFRFEGFRSGDRRVAADYLIRHDCCHVEKVSGPAVITVGR